MERFNASDRSARKWLDAAYWEVAAEADVDRNPLVGTALRRRLVIARAAKDGDWKTYLQAADSEAKFLGLNAPVQSGHHVAFRVRYRSKRLHRATPAALARRTAV